MTTAIPVGAIHPGKSSDGKTYALAVNGTTVCEIEWESDTAAPLAATWKSGAVTAPRAIAYQTLRCRSANGAPVVKVYDKENVERVNIDTTGKDRPLRVPGGWRTTEASVQLELSAGVVESVGLWDSMADAQ